MMILLESLDGLQAWICESDFRPPPMVIYRAVRRRLFIQPIEEFDWFAQTFLTRRYEYQETRRSAKVPGGSYLFYREIDDYPR